MKKQMKVLLVSPRDPDQPKKFRHLMGGENTYTMMLLKSPPQGVTFIHYEKALTEKYISYDWHYYLLLFLQKIRFLPPGPRAQIFKLHQPFDLVYSHVYPIKIVGIHIPIVISDSSSNAIFLHGYLNLPKIIVKIWNFFKGTLYTYFDVIDGEINTHKAARFFVFSKWAKQFKHEIGIGNCDVLYPGFHLLSSKKHVLKKTIRILFIGIWFERKGGRILLKVFRKLSKQYAHITLTIIGEFPDDIKIRPQEKITHHSYLPRDEIIELFQKHDILVHIPTVTEGFGVVVVEALHYGLAIIVSNVCALPELIEHNKSGLVIEPKSEIALEKALTALIIGRKLRKKLGNNARKRFQMMFAHSKFQKSLVRIFMSALRFNT